MKATRISKSSVELAQRVVDEWQEEEYARNYMYAKWSDGMFLPAVREQATHYCALGKARMLSDHVLSLVFEQEFFLAMRHRITAINDRQGYAATIDALKSFISKGKKE